MKISEKDFREIYQAVESKVQSHPVHKNTLWAPNVKALTQEKREVLRDIFEAYAAGALEEKDFDNIEGIKTALTTDQTGDRTRSSLSMRVTKGAWHALGYTVSSADVLQSFEKAKIKLEAKNQELQEHVEDFKKEVADIISRDMPETKKDELRRRIQMISTYENARAFVEAIGRDPEVDQNRVGIQMKGALDELQFYLNSGRSRSSDHPS